MDLRSLHAAVRALPLLLIAAALPARAQVQQPTDNQFTLELLTPAFTSLSRRDCERDPQADLSFRWSKQLQSNSEKQTVFISDKSDCSTELSVLREEETRTQQEETFPAVGEAPLTPAELFDIAVGEEGESCGGEDGIDRDLFLCVKIESVNIFQPVTRIARIRFNVDSRAPAAPRNLRVQSLDSALLLEWDMPSETGGAERFAIYHRPVGGDETRTVIVGSELRSRRLTGLENDTTYEVQISALDNAGSQLDFANESARSELVEGTPVRSQDFWERYRERGGSETGGCSQTGRPGMLAVFGLGALLLFRRRRAGWLAAAIVLTSATGLAQPLGPRDYRSPQRFTFELRAGPFRPDVDSEPGLQGTPFADVFGTESSPWMGRASLDWDFLHTAVGRFSVGVSGGYWEIVGKGRSFSDDEPTNDTVLFSLAPFAAHLVYRADVVWRRWGVPLVPFARGGYGLVRWSTRKATGDGPSQVDGEEGAGWGRGLEYGGGLQLVLDYFDPASAISLDQELGVNYSAIFVEFARYDWRGAHGLRLDGNNIQVGVSLAF